LVISKMFYNFVFTNDGGVGLIGLPTPPTKRVLLNRKKY
jgi:hypothetical protein